MGVLSTGNITSGYSPFGRICSFFIIIKNLRSSARCYRLSLHRLHSLPGHGAAHAGLRHRLPLCIKPHHLSCRAGEFVLLAAQSRLNLPPKPLQARLIQESHTLTPPP